MEIFCVSFFQSSACLDKLDIVDHTIVVRVGAQNRFADRLVKLDVVSFVKVFSDGVKQCRKFFLGQRLAGMVSVKSSENVVDLSPLAFRQFDTVRGICKNLKFELNRE